MEYPFKDLLPLDEVLEREGYYKDWTHLDPEVFYSLTQISEYIKTKGYGVDVRLLIAQLAEHFGLKTTQVVDLANLLQQRFTNLEGVTQSFTNNINSLVAQMEADKNAVIANATVDSEVILARGGKDTLQDRLDETDAQLVQTGADIRVGYYDGPLVSFVFDDGRTQDWTRFKPIFESEGVPGCANIIVGRMGESPFMTWEQLRVLKDMGWTIASHTMNHLRYADEPESVIDADFRDSSRILNDKGFDGDIIVYPFGSFNEKVERVARRYYKMGVDIIKGPVNTPPLMNNFQVSRVPGLSQASGDYGGVEPTLEQCKAIVDKAITDKAWILFEDHSAYPIWDALKLEELRQLIQYIKSKGVPIVNLQDGYAMKANVLDLKSDQSSTRVFRNGQTDIQSAELGNHLVYGRMNAFSSTTPIGSFRDNSVSTFYFDSNGSTGFPVTAGSVTTYRFSANFGWNWQELRAYGRNKKYTRYLLTDGSWGKWSSDVNIWVGTINMSATYQRLGQSNMQETLEIAKAQVVSTSVAYTVDSKLYTLDGISTDPDNPTNIGTVGSIVVQAYRNTDGDVLVKHDRSGANHKVYFRVYYS